MCTGFLPVCLKQCLWLLPLSFFSKKSSYGDSGQKVLEGIQKSSCLRDVVKQGSLVCVRCFPNIKWFQNFGIWYFVRMIQILPLNHGICLCTAYGYIFFFLLGPVGILPKVLFFVLLSHSLSNTFSWPLVSNSQKLETVVLSVFICVFDCMVCKNTGTHRYRQHAVAGSPWMDMGSVQDWNILTL